MSDSTYTHNEAILIRLLISNGEWVSNPDLMKFTRRNCKSACYPIHSRISDLRKLYGYNVLNKTTERDGVKHSTYMIHLPQLQLSALRKLWTKPGRKGIPHKNQVKAMLRPVQTSMTTMFQKPLV